MTSIIESEKHYHLWNAILILFTGIWSLCDGGATIRVNPAPGFSALQHDKFHLSHGIKLEVGHSKNPNKNPVAECALEKLSL